MNFPWLKQKPVVIPLVLEDPPEWTDNDRKLASLFFNAGPGSKLKKILYYEMMNDALRPGLQNDHMQGMRQGKNAMLARILNLSEVDEDTGKQDA